MTTRTTPRRVSSFITKKTINIWHLFWFLLLLSLVLNVWLIICAPDDPYLLPSRREDELTLSSPQPSEEADTVSNIAQRRARNNAMTKASSETSLTSKRLAPQARPGDKSSRTITSASSLSSLHAANNKSNSTATHKADILPPILSKITYLGILVDSGRHMFSWKWLYNLLETLSLMEYNMIHFRLTDDQLFSMELEGMTLVDKNFYTNLEWNYLEEQFQNMTHASTLVDESIPRIYKQRDLNAWVKYAKSKYNITVIPEINIPGHGGAWGPEWVVPCPKFTCYKGYGLPLNVTHPDLPDLLTSILQQVIQVFDKPPYLHLGGDEVDMAARCLQEANVSFEPTWLEDIEHFERDVLTKIIASLGYDQSQIVRWENVHQNPPPVEAFLDRPMTPNQKRIARRRKPKKPLPPPPPRIYYRAGDNTQYWMQIPPPRSNQTTTSSPWFASTGLYMDVLTEYANGYGAYNNTWNLIAAANTNPYTGNSVMSELRKDLPTAVIAGAFELSEETWLDRNVVGRLLAVRMALSQGDSRMSSPQAFEISYLETCASLVDDWRKQQERSNKDDNSNPKILLPACYALGYPLLDPDLYKAKWQHTRQQWKDYTCQLLAVARENVQVDRVHRSPKRIQPLNEMYWEGVLVQSSDRGLERQQARYLSLSFGQSEQRQPVFLPTSATINKAGILVDLLASSFLPTLDDFRELFQKMNRLGLTWMQLRVANDDGVAIDLGSLGVNMTGYRLRDNESPFDTHDSTKKVYQPHEIDALIEMATSMGIEIVPEASVTTNAGGWHGRKILAQCPQHLCETGRNIPIDLSEEGDTAGSSNDVYPTILAAILALKRLFRGSNYFHLGHDERMASLACLEEAGITDGLGRWEKFESKLALAMRLMGMNLGRVSRWENQEKERYLSRTGEITQHTTLPERANLDSDKEIWGRVDLEGLSPWEIYTKSRQWSDQQASLSRLVAGHLTIGREEARYSPKVSSSSRLIAYAIGVSDVTNRDEESFTKLHAELCLQIGNCKPAFSPKNQQLSTKNHFLTDVVNSGSLSIEELNKGCKDRTRNLKLYSARKHKLIAQSE